MRGSSFWVPCLLHYNKNYNKHLKRSCFEQENNNKMKIMLSGDWPPRTANRLWALSLGWRLMFNKALDSSLYHTACYSLKKVWYYSLVYVHAESTSHWQHRSKVCTGKSASQHCAGLQTLINLSPRLFPTDIGLTGTTVLKPILNRNQELYCKRKKKWVVES